MAGSPHSTAYPSNGGYDRHGQAAFRRPPDLAKLLCLTYASVCVIFGLTDPDVEQNMMVSTTFIKQCG
jgi:hypothetical protein